MIYFVLILSLAGSVIYLYMIGFRVLSPARLLDMESEFYRAESYKDELIASERGIYELQESYEMQILTLNENVFDLNMKLDIVKQEYQELLEEKNNFEISWNDKDAQVEGFEETIADLKEKLDEHNRHCLPVYQHSLHMGE